MKKNQSHEKMAHGQYLQGIQHVPVVNVPFTQGIYNPLFPHSTERPGANGDHPTTWGHHTGKAPPGRARAPGAARGHPPANKAGPPGHTLREPVADPHSVEREGQGLSSKTSFPINIQILNTKKTKIFITILKFKIMKKQILILALFVLAALANVSNSYGQGPTALAPAPGVAYDYAVTIAGTTDATGTKYQFWVTKDVNLYTGAHVPSTSGDFTVNAAGATYDDVANATNHINLTWSVASTASATAYYLVVKYVETANGCQVENEKVWQIKPFNTFYLTMVPSDASGTTVLPANAQQCVAGIAGATISVVDPNPTVSRVTYTYGKNTLYYKVTAAGMLGTWRPDLQLPALGGLNQAYESAQWNPNLDGSGTWYSFTGAAGATPIATTAYLGVDTELATITDATNGTPILIRVVVDNKNFETLSDQAITAGIDGYLPSFPSTTSDVVSATVFTPELPFGKTATNTILKRPTETGTTIPFVQKNP